MTEAPPHPVVSVVIPCYNAEPFIRETVDSAFAQTHPQVEIIVVDDASTDRSWDVVSTYGDQITAVRLERNGGGSRARNHGARLATGNFLMFLDADDVLAPDALAGLLEALREKSGDIAGCRWLQLKKRDGDWRKLPADIPIPDPAGDPLRGWITGSSWFPPAAVLWRRDVYDRVGGWDEEITLNDDGDIMMRALADGARLVVAERGQAYYRSHGDERLSVSTNVFSESKLHSQRRVIEKLESKLTEQGRLTEYAEPLGIAYQYLALLALQNGHMEIGRDCQRRGETIGGFRPVSRTFAGRFLSRVVGVERKEKIAAALARLGFATRERRQFRTLTARHTVRQEAEKRV